MLYPVGFSVVFSCGRGLAHGIRTPSHAVVRFVEAGEIQLVYQSAPRLRAFAARHSLSWKTAKKVLEANGVDFSAQVRAEFENGMSLIELSEKHGPKAETLSNWLELSGVRIQRGNFRRGINVEDLVRVFRATSSVNQVARHAGIHWSTAARLLRKAGAM